MAFPIPVSFPDLEGPPYELLPYPIDFCKDDDVSTLESFEKLVQLVSEQNEQLTVSLRNDEAWVGEERLQALYTLVRYVLEYLFLIFSRKSTTLPPNLRESLVQQLVQSIDTLSRWLPTTPSTVSQHVRDAWNCEIYFLYSFLFFLESDAKGQADSEPLKNLRRLGINALEQATLAMKNHANKLWKQGVPDEAVLLLPCKIAYQLLELCTGVVARKTNCGDQALSILQETMNGFPETVGAIAAALMDLILNFEHVGTLVAELCHNDRLALELLREIKSPHKNLASWMVGLSQVRPKLIQQHFASLQQFLSTEPYHLRSAIVSAIPNIVLATPDEHLLEILLERVHDTSSFTRAATLKAWIRLAEGSAIPKSMLLVVTQRAADRLSDKTVLVRKNALQLLQTILEHNPFPALHPEPYRRKQEELVPAILTECPENLKSDSEAATLRAALGEVHEWADVNATLTAEQQSLSQKVQALEFTQLALDFIEILEPKDVLEGMLWSKTTSDVTEALRFLVQARQFQLPCSMKPALALLWSTDATVRKEALQAFVDVFVGDAPPATIAQNIMGLVSDATESELASIEEAVVRLVAEERLPDDVFLVLWSIVAKSESLDARATALQVLSMGAGADRSIIDSKSRLKLILDSAFERVHWKLYGAAAACLQRVARASVDISDAKFLILERLQDALSVVVRGEYCEEDTGRWMSISEQSLRAIFVIAPEPERVCREIVTKMYEFTFSNATASASSLARFCHVIGNVALQLLVYTEALSGSVRRANAKKSSQKEVDTMEDELGVAAQLEAENERRLADIAEHEIVGRNLLSSVAPLLVRLVGTEDFQKSDILRQSATLALCKLMCVSNEFCEKQLPLLFTVLGKASDDDITMRSNTVVALGDLAFRFPNTFEPYTPHLYGRLRDPSTKVRRHTLMVLTHLILNDMVKVKGQVSEVAQCLRDADLRIRDMSRLLFHELAKRSNNPVYNLLPEIISQLSQVEMEKGDFRSIMGFLLGYIKKDRQHEMLAEKLCLRFPKCTGVSQAADLAFCLAQLKFNEKSIKCLSDNFNLYKDVLHDDDVSKSFATIVTKGKKSLKQDKRHLVDEWETKLQDHASRGAENLKATQNAAKARKRASRRAARQKKLVVEDDDDEELDFVDKENETRPVRRSGRRVRA